MTSQFPNTSKIVLSPAAQAVLDAYGHCLGSYEAQVNTTYPGATRLAAALRAAADQVAPSDADEPRNSLPMAIECKRIRAELLAIADELEGIKYGTYRCNISDKNND